MGGTGSCRCRKSCAGIHVPATKQCNKPLLPTIVPLLSSDCNKYPWRTIDSSLTVSMRKCLKLPTELEVTPRTVSVPS